MNTQYREEDKTVPISEKLKALYELQTVASEIDKIKTLRGELPLEVQDLEDDITGLKTRISNYEDDIKNLDTSIANRKAAIKESEALIAKYTEQQNNVRNNREYDSLNKEIEFQRLEMELSEKRIREFTAELFTKKEAIDSSKTQLKEREEDLDRKKKELDEITAETKIEEEKLKSKAEKIEDMIESRLLTAFKRIRKNARNGLAVVTVQRDACGGCFNKIPPQRQMDIANRKKIIVCEYCGRILVDKDIMEVEVGAED
ncbi:zinc ribbon domain-containing protein [Gaoshiqia sediminis]|uniref:C4-type zinc ribbon domain-containing protein n=1 Tax=Gaoshiqia sediminis TaxID=2986998 RepID=A0AA42C744_9BACT|nr:C4-type zinc ribbon domain-containing protein [Gaoshiqia sediminis]MCW0481201.1 C4-type zinc ribbon domain-containing protein [Gaoshiqia sediminis]